MPDSIPMEKAVEQVKKTDKLVKASEKFGGPAQDAEAAVRNALVAAKPTLIDSSEATLAKYVDEGMLTPRQAEVINRDINRAITIGEDKLGVSTISQLDPKKLLKKANSDVQAWIDQFNIKYGASAVHDAMDEVGGKAFHTITIEGNTPWGKFESYEALEKTLLEASEKAGKKLEPVSGRSIIDRGLKKEVPKKGVL